MASRIPRRRKLVRENDTEHGIPAGAANTLSSGQAAGAGPFGRSASSHRKAPQAGVTHRSPSPDDMLLPCCGLPLSAVTGRDRLTTDPAQVTCRG
jgi:hypothetical protein